MALEARRSPEKALQRGVDRRTRNRDSARQRMSEAAQTQSDWWGVCRHCGEHLEGNLHAIREHQCG